MDLIPKIDSAPDHNDGYLSGQLRGSFDVWDEDTRVEEGRLHPECGDISVVSQRLYEAVTQVFSSESPENVETLRRAASEMEGTMRQVLDRDINGRLGKTAIGMLAIAERRYPHLEECCRSAKVSEKLRNHLEDIATLFLFGLDRQLLIVARAAIEAALNDLLEETPDGFKDCERTLQGKVEWAWSWGHLRSRLSYVMAEKLRKDANEVLHDIPTVKNKVGMGSPAKDSVDGLVILYATVLVLKDLLEDGDRRQEPLSPPPRL